MYKSIHVCAYSTSLALQELIGLTSLDGSQMGYSVHSINWFKRILCINRRNLEEITKHGAYFTSKPLENLKAQT